MRNNLVKIIDELIFISARSTCQDSHMPRFPHAKIPTCQDSHMPRFPHAKIPTCQDSHMPRFPHAKIPTF
ncbi:hypothetical protein [Sulfurimonas sp.]